MAGTFKEAARALNDAGSGGFRKDLEAAEKKAAERLAARMKAAIPGGLPRSGGLAADAAASSSVAVSTSGSGSVVKTSIQIRSKYNLGRMNTASTFSHPVFGDTSNTVEQSAGVTRGFLDDPFRKGEGDLKKAADAAVKSTATTIDRSVT